MQRTQSRINTKLGDVSSTKPKIQPAWEKSQSQTVYVLITCVGGSRRKQQAVRWIENTRNSKVPTGGQLLPKHSVESGRLVVTALQGVGGTGPSQLVVGVQLTPDLTWGAQLSNKPTQLQPSSAQPVGAAGHLRFRSPSPTGTDLAALQGVPPLGCCLLPFLPALAW